MVTVEEQNIRGLEIDKIVKAVKFTEYVFKNDVTVSPTKSDSIRWYNKTSFGTLSATAAAATANISPLSRFTTLESNVTRNTSYIRKYAVTDYISMEDVEGADIDILALTIIDLTRVIINNIDTRIWDVLTKERAGVTAAATDVNLVTSSGAWTSAAGDPLRDILAAQRTLWVSGGYNAGNPTLYLSPTDYQNLVVWLVTGKGSSIPNFASRVAEDGTVAQLGGIKIKVSPNVTADYAVLALPSIACTWKQFTDTTTEVINHPGLGKEIRVWELGEAILTSPKAVCLISNTQ